MLLIDSGGQKNEKSQKEEAKIEDTLDLESSGADDRSPKIYLNTLSSFTDFRVGSYAMTSLKKMTGTESFLKQTDEQTRCLARFGAGAFSVTSVSASNQPRGHGLRQQSLRP